MKSRKKEDRTIRMIVKDDTDFLSEYSVIDSPVISQEVAQFLEHSILQLRYPGNLKLVVISTCIDDLEKILYKKGIEGYYNDCVLVTRWELSRNRIIAWALCFLGVLTLIAIALFEFTNIWAEVVDIIAWVFLWESVDIQFFTNHGLRNDLRKYEALANMEVEYLEPEINLNVNDLS